MEREENTIEAIDTAIRESEERVERLKTDIGLLNDSIRRTNDVFSTSHLMKIVDNISLKTQLSSMMCANAFKKIRIIHLNQILHAFLENFQN